MAMPVTHVLTPEEVFCLEGCRSYGQYFHMRDQFEKEFCLFCHISGPNIILYYNELACCWSVPKEYMREELAFHFIIIPKRHVRFETDLTEDEVLAIHSLKCLIAKEHNIPGGIIATRFGDMELNAGTVPHLHYNIMVPNGTGEMRIPVFKDPADRASNKERAKVFAKRYEAGEVPS